MNYMFPSFSSHSKRTFPRIVTKAKIEALSARAWFLGMDLNCGAVFGAFYNIQESES